MLFLTWLNYGKALVCRTWILLFFSFPFVAGDFAYADFKSIAGIRMQGVTNQTQNWLRLTPSRPGVVGSAWFNVKQHVIGGFMTEFKVRLTLDVDQVLPGPCKLVSHPSAGEDKRCARRAGDGFAFVIQNKALNALGGGGADLGYGGIHNGLAVEFDTWYDAQLQDPYESHLAIMSRGRDELWSSHTTNVGHTVEIPDLTDGESHLIKIEYDPEMHPTAFEHRSFKAAPHLANLVYPTGKYWKAGLGVVKVYVDDMADPALTVPCNLGSWLNLDSGRAYVGFTASTGSSYQNHDVLSWILLEQKSEMLSTQGRAGVLLRADYDAEPDLASRWNDPVFERTHNYPLDPSEQRTEHIEPNLFSKK